MTVRKKGNKWYCRFQVDGVRYERRCALASNEREALHAESVIKSEIMRGQLGFAKAVKAVKLKDLIQLYLEYSKANKASYKADIHSMDVILSYFNNCSIETITAADIENFKTHIKNTTSNKNATINRYLAALSKMFNLGIENKLIDKNPMRQVHKLKEDNHKIRFLTKEEEIRLFNAIDETNRHIEPILICALQTGMRKGEIFELLKSCVDIKGGFIELLKTKSGKARKIPISDKLKAVLITALSDKNNQSEYVFINPDTGTKYDDIKRSFHTLLKKANIDNFRFHDLRHTVATRLAGANIDLTVVQEILGHSSIQTTMRYAHPVPERKKQAINILNNF